MPPTLPKTKIDLICELSELTLPLMWSLRQDAVRAFESLGVRPVKALLIELIARGLQHPKDLSDVLDTVPPTISAMVAELEAKGFIGRQIDPDDRRRVQLALTPDGEALREQMRVAWIETGKERMQALSVDELTMLVTLYRKILDAT